MNSRRVRDVSPTPPIASWKVQILTPAYLVEGIIPPLQQLHRYLNQPDHQPPLALTSAHVHSLTPAAIAPHTVSRWTMPATSIVALIPRDEASTAAVEQLTIAYQPTDAVVIYTGSYRIRATFLSDGTEPLADTWIAATEAEITYVPDQHQMPRLRTRLLVLCRQWIYGYHAA